MRRLIVHPEPPPILTRLPQIFRLIDQHIHALMRIAGILIENATGVGDAARCQTDAKKQSPHDPAPLPSAVASEPPDPPSSPLEPMEHRDAEAPDSTGRDLYRMLPLAT